MKLSALTQQLALLAALAVLVVSLLAGHRLESALFRGAITWVAGSLAMYLFVIAINRVAVSIITKERARRREEAQRAADEQRRQQETERGSASNR